MLSVPVRSPPQANDAFASTLAHCKRAQAGAPFPQKMTGAACIVSVRHWSPVQSDGQPCELQDLDTSIDFHAKVKYAGSPAERLYELKSNC